MDTINIMEKAGKVDTLSKFGVRLENNNRKEKFYHLQTRFRVRFIGMGVDTEHTNLTMSMKSFTPPKGAFEKQTVELVNGSLYYPGKWNWDESTFTVYNTYDNTNYKALWNQIQRQRDIYEQTTGDAPNTYKFMTIVEHTDGHQKTLSYWVMEGCFLTKANPSENFENGNHAPITIDCGLVFDNATLYDYLGNRIPTTEDSGVISDIGTALTIV